MATATNQRLNVPNDSYVDELIRSSHIPFQRDKIIGYNKNYCGITINQLVGLCRFFMNIFCTSKIAPTLLLLFFQGKNLINDQMSLVEKLRTYSLLFSTFISFLLLLDAINPTFALKMFADYKSEMLPGKFSLLFGINNSVRRFLFLSIMIYQENLSFSTIAFMTHKSSYSESFFYILIDLAYVPVVGIYLILWIVTKIDKGTFRSELQNSWMEDWENKYEIKSAKNRTLSAIPLMFVFMNIVLLMLFMYSFFDFKMTETHFHYDINYFLNNAVPLIAMFLMVYNLVYRIYLRLYDKSIFFAFVSICLVLSYFYIQMIIEFYESDYLQSLPNIKTNLDILGLTLLIAVILNFIMLFLTNSYSIFNFLLWALKNGFSIGGIAAFFFILGALLVSFSGVYASYSLFQQFFYMKVKMAEFMKVFIAAMKFLFEVVMGILKVLFEVTGVLNSTTFGIFCLIIFILFTIVVIPLLFIGFGSSSYVLTAGKIFRFFMNLLGVINSVKQYVNLFTPILQFMSVSDQLNEVASGSSASKITNGGPILILSSMLGILLVIFSIMFTYCLSCGRYSEYPRLTFPVFFFILLICCGLYFLFILAIEWIFSQTYNLIIMVITIIPGWGFVWVKLALLLNMAAIAAFFVAYTFGSVSGYIKNRFFTDRSVIEGFNLPPFVTIVCPLLSIPKEASENDNGVLIICNRLCCCFSSLDIDETEKGTLPVHYLRKIFCPCSVDNNPWQNDFTVANLAFNFCCCCCYKYNKSVKCNPFKCCFCSKRFFKEMNEKRRLDDSHAVPGGVESTTAIDPYESHHVFDQESVELVQNTTVVGEAIREFFSNPFNAFPKFLIPICLSAGLLYMAYKAFMSPWLYFGFKPDSIFATILGDTSTESSSDHLNQIEKSNKVSCPLLDGLNLIMNLFLKAVLGALKGFFKDNKEFVAMIDAIQRSFEELQNQRDLIPPLLRAFFLSPILAYVFILLFFSLISSCLRYFDRRYTIGFLLTIILVYMSLLEIPIMLIGILESIPFLKIDIIEMDGFITAKMLRFFMIFIVNFVLIDHFCEPVYPLYNESVDMFLRNAKEELENPFTIDA